MSIKGINETDTLHFNGDAYFPTQSIFKFHIAIAFLSEKDNGKFSLEEEIEITKEDLLQDAWSPIRKKYTDGTKITLSELIKYTVSKSDNIGCEYLLRLLG